jgi:3-deoxy-manno-octulosonate cytidylyltransferase (CMP-KDO synthetase)
MTIQSGVAAKLAEIRLLVCDVDGVLTEGRLDYGADGEGDRKAFHVRDGLGLRAVMAAGIEVAWITARGGGAVERRAGELGIKHLVQKSGNKATVLAELGARLGIATAAIAYIGDDLVDRDAMRAAGVAIAPADAHSDIRAIAAWVTSINGGRGAVREVCDAILLARSPTPEVEFKIVIPSRMAATRLPGKPLRLLAGRPMVVHVLERARAAIERGQSSITSDATANTHKSLISEGTVLTSPPPVLDAIVVATDDQRIVDAIEQAGGRAVMTRPDHPSGSDRIHEVATSLGWSDDTIVVNLQGDEPGMPAEAIRRVAELLATTPGAAIATLATPIREVRDLFDPAVVKCVIDDRGLARTFSRAPIPFVRGLFDNGRPDALPQGVPFLRHLGLYAYRVGSLRRLCETPPHAWEKAESLEQLRALAIGMQIAVGILDRPPPHGVDTEADLARAEAELAQGLR